MPEVHGHRGCAALMPENTIPAFIKATELGCHWLELDVVVNADNELVVSHEPWMDHRTCLAPGGRSILGADERAFNIYQMSAAQVRECELVGLRQMKARGTHTGPLHKPLLREVVSAVRAHAGSIGKPMPRFNVEIKSEERFYGTYQPWPEAYAECVLQELRGTQLLSNCLVQCFDPRVLEVLHARCPSLAIGLLVEGSAVSVHDLDKLSFTPRFFGPPHGPVDESLMHAVRARGVGLCVWTVNEVHHMQRMIALGVEGIVTDHPDRLLELLGAQV
jgi:glycerophosphoryl diester phosphodiesterase